MPIRCGAQLGKHVFFLDGVGGFAADHARTLQPSDLLVVVSYNTYAHETIAIAEHAKAAGASTRHKLPTDPIGRNIFAL